MSGLITAIRPLRWIERFTIPIANAILGETSRADLHSTGSIGELAYAAADAMISVEWPTTTTAASYEPSRSPMCSRTHYEMTVGSSLGYGIGSVLKLRNSSRICVSFLELHFHRECTFIGTVMRWLYSAC